MLPPLPDGGREVVGFTVLCLVNCTQFSVLRIWGVLLALKGGVCMHVGR